MLTERWRQLALDSLKNFQKTLPSKAPDRWSPVRPSEPAFRQAKLVLDRMPNEPLPEPLVQATVDGGLQFEWEQDNRELDIAVSSTGEIGYIKVISRTAIEEGVLDLDQVGLFDQVGLLTNWLRYGR